MENKGGDSSQIITCSIDCTLMIWDLRPPKATVLPISPAKAQVTMFFLETVCFGFYLFKR